MGRPMQSPQPEENLDDIEVPLYVEPFKGWRTWNVQINSDSVQLKSITYRVKWPYKKPMRAHCLVQWRYQRSTDKLTDTHSAPHLKHGCGIYSTKIRKDVNLWTSQSTTQLAVVGEVKLWGKTFCFKKGYVSEFAYPTSIFVDPAAWNKVKEENKTDITPHELMNALAESYDVPVVIEGS